MLSQQHAAELRERSFRGIVERLENALTVVDRQRHGRAFIVVRLLVNRVHRALDDVLRARVRRARLVA